MKIGTRHYLLSLAGGLVMALLVFVTSSLPGSYTGVLWAPGFFGAALVFPEGVHGYSPMAWFVLAAVLNVLVFSGAVLGVWVLIGRFRRQPSKEA